MGTTIHFTNRKKRKPYNPKVGDRKTSKGIDYVRVRRMHRGAYMVSDGRPLYDWVPVDSLDERQRKWLRIDE